MICVQRFTADAKNAELLTPQEMNFSGIHWALLAMLTRTYPMNIFYAKAQNFNIKSPFLFWTVFGLNKLNHFSLKDFQASR